MCNLFKIEGRKHFIGVILAHVEELRMTHQVFNLSLYSISAYNNAFPHKRVKSVIHLYCSYYYQTC